MMWGADKVSAPCCGSLLAWCRGLTPTPSPGLISALLSLGSWHSCPDPCQILEKRQMGLAFYVLIKEEFAPSQTRHLWPLCLVTFIIHPQRGEVSRCKGFRTEWRMSRRRGRGYGAGWGDEHLSSLFQLPARSSVPQFFIWRQWTSCSILSNWLWSTLCFYCLHSHSPYLLHFLSFLVTTWNKPYGQYTQQNGWVSRRQECSLGILVLFKGQMEDICDMLLS